MSSILGKRAKQELSLLLLALIFCESSYVIISFSAILIWIIRFMFCLLHQIFANLLKANDHFRYKRDLKQLQRYRKLESTREKRSRKDKGIGNSIFVDQILLLSLSSGFKPRFVPAATRGAVTGHRFSVWLQYL